MKTIHNCALTRYNSYQIPARCRVAYFPESADEVAALFRDQLAQTSPIILGSGHNVILACDFYDAPFVIFHGNLNQIHVCGEIMTIGAGAFTQDVCEKALAHALSGFELFYDIPSSIGGAIVMNAGYPDEDISGILETVTYLDTCPSGLTGTETPSPAGNARLQPGSQSPPAPKPCPRTIPNAAAGFRYRNSIFQQDPTKIVLSATFRLRKDDPARIREKMHTIKAERWAKQPREYPNAGSVFKRPAGRYVGPMLDELQLKGYTHGGFRVSPKHSGFIEKVGPATGQQLLELIQHIQQRVQDRFDIQLEPEQRIIPPTKAHQSPIPPRNRRP